MLWTTLGTILGGKNHCAHEKPKGAHLLNLPVFPPIRIRPMVQFRLQLMGDHSGCRFFFMDSSTVQIGVFLTIWEIVIMILHMKDV